MKLLDPKPKYDPSTESENKRILEKADTENYKHGNDVQIGSLPRDTRRQRLILVGRVSGTRYSLEIDDTTPSSPSFHLVQL